MNNRGIKSLLKKYYHYSAIVLLFVALVVVLVACTKRGDVPVEVATKENEGLEVEFVPFEKDSNEAVVDLIRRFYEACEKGDIDAIKEICPEYDDEEAEKTKNKSEYIDEYTNIECNIKPGPHDNEYIVFVYYEIKFHNIDTTAPGLVCYYVRTAEDGSLYIDDDADGLDEQTEQYIKAIRNQDDVKELRRQIDEKYTEASSSDEVLKNFMEQLPTLIKPKKTGSEDESAAAEPATMVATLLDTVNVRTGPGTENDSLGKLMKGDKVTVLENQDNGWSKVDFQGQEAYIKTEFLQLESAAPTQTDTTDGAENAAGDAAAQTETQPEAQSQSSDGSVPSKIRVTGDSVRIRESVDSGVSPLGTAQKGDEFTVKGKEGNFYKVEYKGREGFISVDFAEPV